MKTKPALSLLLAAAVLLAAGPAAAADKSDAATIIALKRVSDRYTLTKVRVSSLLDARMNPTPPPANPPNPFFRAPDEPADVSHGTPGGVPDTSTLLPAEADESDAGTLLKFVSKLKISGLSVLNGVPRLTLNQTLCKAGDIIPVETKGHTVYIQVLKITTEELTLGLNEERQVVRVRK